MPLSLNARQRGYNGHVEIYWEYVRSLFMNAMYAPDVMNPIYNIIRLKNLTQFALYTKMRNDLVRRLIGKSL